MNNHYPHLFTPLKVGRLTFRNRLVSGPTMMCMVEPGGVPSDYLIGYYEAKARGGAAQVTVGDTPVDETHGVTIPRHLVLEKPNLPKLSELARAISRHGAVASIELDHGGRVSSNPIGPVGFIKPNGVAVIEMDEHMMDEVAGKFAAAAALVKQAGFDMCMLHGAHGWLLDQFLSPLFNTRTDGYGGSLMNRARFPIMVIDRVRQAVGRDFPIEYRIGAELKEGGLEIGEVIEFIKMIEDKIDLIHVSAGLDTDPEFAVKTHPTMFLPHGVNVHFAAAVKAAGVKVPVVTVGSITSAEEAEAILASGQADAVAMVRSLIADPDLPNKARTGRADETIPCLRCLDCLALMQVNTQFACAVNPRTGREFYLDATEKPAAERKRVLVVGGGPAGMRAAITAAGRGHDVTLAEKTGALGGLLAFTDYDSLKYDLKRYKDWLIRMVGKTGAKVLYNTEVDLDYVNQFKPDALICAVGSSPIVLPLPGIEKAKHATAAYTDLGSLGQRVAIIGGGLVGCETALFLAGLGKQVRIIEMQDALAPDANHMHRTGMLQAFEKTAIAVYTGTRCKAVTAAGVEAVGPGGEAVFIEADSVVYALGQRANTALADKLYEADVPYYAVAGDCKKAQKVSGGAFAAYHAAMDI